MKCVVVDMRNRLFGDAISGSLQHFDSGFRVYQTEGTAAEDLCVDTHADVPAVAAGTAAGPVPEAAAGAARLPGGAGGR